MQKQIETRGEHPARRLGAGEVPSLDGLRAVSVLIVMVAHSGLGWIVPGGFGVTLFFFISGFIITTLLIREQGKRGSIDIRGFYLRRALRLYPALVAFLVVLIAALAVGGHLPGATAIAGGFLYFMNYLVIFAPGQVLPHGNHLWSLAVEAHYYLLYPLLFAWLAPNWRRLAIALGGVCLASLAVRVGASFAMSDKGLLYEYAYQASEARLDSIAFGALLAAVLFADAGRRAAAVLMRPTVVAAAAAALAASLLIRHPVFRDTFRYTLQGLALMPVVAALVLGARSSLAVRMLNARAMILAGGLSYSLYLWHLATFAYGKHLVGSVPLGIAIGWMLAIALAAASYAWIEQPMLKIRSRFGSERARGTSSKGTTDMRDSTATAKPDAVTGIPRAHVDGWPIHLANREEALEALVSAARRGEGYSFCPLNLDLLVKLRHDPVFGSAMRKARFIIADGWPIAMLGRRQDPTIERTTGADLVVPLAEAAARHGLPVYLFGTSDPVLASVRADLERRLPALRVAGLHSPKLGFDPTSPAADEAIDRIIASGARICFLALGAPKQEILAARALERGAKAGFISVGAGLDFLAGAQVRAPGLMRDNGMEWLWRLANNPRRLGARYAACVVHLARLVVVEPMQRRLGLKPIGRQGPGALPG